MKRKITIVLGGVLVVFLTYMIYTYCVTESLILNLSENVTLEYKVHKGLVSPDYYKEVNIIAGDWEESLSIESVDDEIVVLLVERENVSSYVIIEDKYVCTYIFALNPLRRVDLKYSCDENFDLINAKYNLGQVTRREVVNDL